MRNLLLTLAIVLTTIATRGQANETAETYANLGTTATAVEVPPYEDWYKQADQLADRTENVSGDNGGCRGRSGRDGAIGRDYAGLRSTYAYDGLRKDIYGDLTVRCPFQEITLAPLQFVSDMSSPLDAPGWIASQRADTDRCPDGEDRNCPPLVCKAGNCEHNYAVVFSAKWCRYCPKMWPVVNELRRRGYIIFYLDVDKYPKSVQQFKVKAMPTTIVIEDGELLVRFTGVTTADKIAEHLKTRKEQGLKPLKENK